MLAIGTITWVGLGVAAVCLGIAGVLNAKKKK